MCASPSDLLIKPLRAEDGVITRVSADAAGWELLSMEARALRPGQTWRGVTGEHEQVFVMLGGVADFETSRGSWASVGRRPNVFAGMPHAVYLPRGTSWSITATTDCEIASCWVPTDEDHPPRLVTPADSRIEVRGGHNATRQINSIIPPGFDCHRLVCVEVYTPGGNWSSYPPHKHDVHVERDGEVVEADLEEIYYYKIRDDGGPRGYAIQRVYNGDRSLDFVAAAHDDDVVLVPEGYHPVSAAYGYDCYYLNFLAGSAQSLANTDDPDYAWVKGTWDQQDPRVPLVTHAMEL